jgi:hypothetical protein
MLIVLRLTTQFGKLNFIGCPNRPFSPESPLRSMSPALTLNFRGEFGSGQGHFATTEKVADKRS